MNPKYTNKLIHETSPYLLQHANNPVNWQPWSNEAFVQAEKEGKLVLISIGYSACHWCHVMAHESFEDERLAQILNDNYVCIKVDREERPDVDQVYMQAVQMITGQGGWPLNCFALPDGRPVYGGTYFRQKDWENVLTGLNTTYQMEKERILKAADQLMEGLQQSELINIESRESEITEDHVHEAVVQLKKDFDFKFGGSKGAPKFPLPVGLNFLMHYQYQYGDEEVKKHIENTLLNMASGGIYDHVEGGFARYSVDSKWHAPHFEKMLYDNGQLVSIYALAYKQNPHETYKEVIEQTLSFVDSNLSTEDGAFYSALDADSEGVEGKYYTWSYDEIQSVLADDAHWFCSYFNISKEGNWEGTNIVWLPEFLDKLKATGVNHQEFYKRVKPLFNKLLRVRQHRIKPGLDNKILCSWNAIMSIAYLDAYETLQYKEYLDKAIQNYNYINSKLTLAGGKLLHCVRGNSENIPAFLDDYAYFIQLSMRLFGATLEQSYLSRAHELIQFVMVDYIDIESKLFYYSSSIQNDVVIRKKETMDNVIPSSNALMANNLYEYGTLTGNQEYVDYSRQMVQKMQANIEQVPSYHGCWLSLMLKMTKPYYQIAVIGANAKEIKNELISKYLPNCIIAASINKNEDFSLFKGRFVENKTPIYCCENNACKLPVYNSRETFVQIEP